MANEKVYAYRNAGTENSPLWEKYFNRTIADAVQMGADDPTTIKEYVDNKIADLIGGSPETADTLKELYDIITTNKDLQDALDTAIAGKADKDHTHDLANTQTAGFMSPEQVTKLNNLAAESTKVEGSDTNGNIKINGSETVVYTHPDSHPATMITEDETHRFVTDAEKEAWDGSSTYTNATPTVSSLGGIEAGSTFDNMTIPEVLDKLLYPYVAPVVSATAQPVNGGTFELGTTSTITAVKATVTKKSSAITSVAVYDGSTELVSQTEGVSNGGTFTLSIPSANQNITADKTYTVKVLDKDGKTTTANTGAFKFVYPFYVGSIADDATVDAATVTALTKKIEAKGNKTIAYTCTNQRMVFAYPASYGNLKAANGIVDPNNLDVTNSFTKSTVAIQTADGKTTNYNVYVNSASTVSNFNMKFNF